MYRYEVACEEGLKHDIHIKPKSYKFELLEELVVEHNVPQELWFFI